MNTIEFDTKIIQTAEIISNTNKKILKSSHLSALQREDFSAISRAIYKFIDEAQKSKHIIIAPDEIEAKRDVRHNLRNHLNIVVGFSSLIIKELPDNLLFNMASIHQICALGKTLIERVDSIQ